MESRSIRFRAETAKILEEKYNKHIQIYMDGSKKDEKVGCAVITPDQKFRKRLKPQNMVYSAEQDAIKVINVTQRTAEYRVIIMDTFSTLIALTGNINSKNPKTLSLDEEREKVTLLRMPGHIGIPRNEIADEESKAALEDDLLAIEKYPPPDLINLIKHTLRKYAFP
jgi:hypothetical protein